MTLFVCADSQILIMMDSNVKTFKAVTNLCYYSVHCKACEMMVLGPAWADTASATQDLKPMWFKKENDIT